MFAFLSSIFDFGKTVFGWIQETSQAKHDLKLAAIQSRQAIIESDNTANTAWAIAILTNEGNGLRWASFVIAVSPIVASLVSPVWGQHMNDAWSRLPALDVEIVRGILLAIWGLKPFHHLVGATVGAVVDAIKQPRLS